MPINVEKVTKIDDQPACNISIPVVEMKNIPVSIGNEIQTDAGKILSEKSRIIHGPTDSNAVIISNAENPSEPITVTEGSKNVLKCLLKNCSRFIAFKVCCHTFAAAAFRNILVEYIEKVNSSDWSDVFSRAVNVGKGKGCGKKKTKATQKRKGPTNCKRPKIQGYVEATNTNNIAIDASGFPINNFVDITVDCVQSEQILTPPIQTPDLFPNPLPNCYVLSILKCCHKNVSKCYGCGGNFYQNGYPAPPNDLLVVSKTQRKFFDPLTKQLLKSPQLQNVYFHFNYVCISSHDNMFTPQSIIVCDNIKPFLTDIHRSVLISFGII